MTATNHALTGSFIALSIDQPFLAVPIAFASHFVLDIFPHYGFDRCGYGEYFKHRLSWVILGLDLFGMVVFLSLTLGAPWIMYIGALVAISPDLAWPYRYYFFEKRGLAKPGEGSAFNRWHTRIQWCERPWGIAFEIVWFVIMLSLVLAQL